MKVISNKQNVRGFTLIEMIVAVAVFAVLGTLAYGGLNQVLKGQNLLQTSSNQLKDLQLTFRYLEKDINQLVNRPIRNQYQDLQPAFVGDEDKAMSFTHAGWRNPGNLARSKLQRVSYELLDNTLKRYTWGQLDGAIAEEYFTTDLLDGVESIKLRYFGIGRWHERWPPLNTANNQEIGVPTAMEMIIKVNSIDEIKRIFVAPATS